MMPNQIGELRNQENTSDFVLPNMPGEFQLNNAATAITGLFSIKSKLPVSINSINKGLENAQVMGRLQILSTKPEWLIDVAHNPHAAKQLAKYIHTNPVTGKTFALFSMLRDKDVKEVIKLMSPVIDEWHIVATEGSRGLSVEVLKQHFKEQNQSGSNEQKVEQSPLKQVKSYSSFSEACSNLKNMTKPQDRVVAFGSFLVISEILNNCK